MHLHYYELTDDVITNTGANRDFHLAQLGAVAANFTGQTFALTFTSANEERFTTIPIVLDGESTPETTTADYIKEALESLPNGVIDTVTVQVAYNDDGVSITGTVIDDFVCDVLAVVTFDGTQVSEKKIKKTTATKR